MVNTIFNEDCFISMERMSKEVDLVITSPPYNTTSRTNAKDAYNRRYDGYNDKMTKEEYANFTVNLFNAYDKVLKENGVVAYNLSYSSENTDGIWITIGEIIAKTNFTIADTIVWKKRSAIPNNRSKNKLTRICEFVFIFVRKDELKTFNCNKKVMSVIEKTGQKNFENVYNFIDAKNNDGSTKLNKATFSSDFVSQILSIYATKDSLVYDSFMGTGTTAVACRDFGCSYVGSELSQEQCSYAEDRILSK